MRNLTFTMDVSSLYVYGHKTIAVREIHTVSVIFPVGLQVCYNIFFE